MAEDDLTYAQIFFSQTDAGPKNGHFWFSKLRITLKIERARAS